MSEATKNDALEFFNTICDPSKLYEIRILPCGLSEWGTPESLIERLARFGRLNAQGQNIYIGALPRKAHGGKKDVDVTPGSVCWVDFDHTTTDDAVKRILEAGLPNPTLVINSGNGAHAWWRFDEEIEPQRIRNLNERLAEILGSDSTVKNAGRIMRLPGFFNVKDPKNPKKCFITSKGQIIELNVLEEIIKETNEKISDEIAINDQVIKEGSRNNSLFHIACVYRKEGKNETEILDVLRAINLERCKPPLELDELKRISKSAMRYEKSDGYSLDDIGNGKRLVDKFRTKIVFVPEIGKWRIYDGAIWKLDHGAVERCAKAIASEIRLDALVSDVGLIKKHAKYSGSDSAQKAMLRQASTEPNMSKSVKEFDNDIMLFNVQNGTIELSTGMFRRSRSEDYLSKISPVHYSSDAKCPIWMEFLSKIMGADEEMLDYLQSISGYALTGNTGTRAFFVAFGEGRNGKSVFAETLAYIMGDYATVTRPETILNRGESNESMYELARLIGYRFVRMAESDAKGALAGATIKQWTGNDEVAARNLYQSTFTYLPQFKLWLSTNHLPEADAYDQAIWDRICQIPFSVRIKDDEIDEDLQVKLREEAPGILNWAIEGCVRWQKHGLRKPEKVIAATRKYRSLFDQVGRFISESNVKKTGRIPKGDLYETYKRWAEMWEDSPLSKKQFGMILGRMGYSEQKSGSVRYWVGLSIGTKGDATNNPDRDNRST